MKHRSLLLILSTWLSGFYNRAAAEKKDVLIPPESHCDLAVVLREEFSEWYSSLATKGVLREPLLG